MILCRTQSRKNAQTISTWQSLCRQRFPTFTSIYKTIYCSKKPWSCLGSTKISACTCTWMMRASSSLTTWSTAKPSIFSKTTSLRTANGIYEPTHWANRNSEDKPKLAVKESKAVHLPPHSMTVVVVSMNNNHQVQFIHFHSRSWENSELATPRRKFDL